MPGLPGDQVPPGTDWISAELAALRKELTELRAAKSAEATTIGGGGITVTGSGSLLVTNVDGDQILFAGGRTDVPRPDGFPQPAVTIGDDAGRARMMLIDPAPLVDGYSQEWFFYDNAGRPFLTTDVNGGIADPWIPVPMYRQFHDTSTPDTTATTETLPVSACSGGVAWEGRIGKVSHPWIQVDGTWGRVTGTTGTPTYSFWANGSQIGSSWSQTTLGTAIAGPFDISSYLGLLNVVVQIKISATGTGTDRVAVGVLGCWMRQT